MRKPEEKIYKEVFEQAVIKGNETLFKDDNKEDVKKSQKVGINAITHYPQNEIIDSLENYLSQFNS